MNNNMSYGEDYKMIPATSINSRTGLEVRPDIYCYTIQIVNVVFVGQAGAKDFVMIDAGMPKSAEHIITAVEDRFGAGSRPRCIILTHAHFDHVGAIIELIEHWDVPVYAHELELPYLTGQTKYPQPDASVEGGMVSKMSPMFPIDPINLGTHVQKLPADGTVPELPDFRWIHTPGHSVGHVSLFREADKTLIAGDAFVTVKQEYLYKVFTQEQEISGPPRYLTPDWTASRASVEKLYDLHPEVAVTGHGVPMEGEQLQNSLQKLVEEFDQIAVPDYGQYVGSR